jgi:UDP-glucose 4-epimerase
MNLLITGGCGFIGSNITEYFLENKLFDSITIVDNLSTGFMKNIDKIIIIERFSESLDKIIDITSKNDEIIILSTYTALMDFYNFLENKHVLKRDIK